MIINKLRSGWICFWMHYAGLNLFGRIATRLASWFAPPYTARFYLAKLNPVGYIDPTAIIYHANLHLGSNVFIADRVVINQVKGSGEVELGNRVHILRDTIIATGEGGEIIVGEDTYIQPRCQIMGYKGKIHIGNNVQIGPNCAFYSYNHGFASDQPIKDQQIYTKGGIFIGDNAWLGFGVIVLDGVRVGDGAVIGAGSVVRDNIPAGAIAVGVPASVIKMRNSSSKNIAKKR